MANVSADRRSLVDRALNIFAPVHAGEGSTVLVMTLNIFLILLAYYVLKPIRDSLIVNAELFGVPGDQLKAYLQPALAFLLIFIIQGYGVLASRVNRARLVTVTSAFVVVAILVFAGLVFAGMSGTPVAIAYFLFLGIVNVFLIAQFWSFANDVYSEKQGRRLFAAIAIGQSVGAILGAYATRALGEYTAYLMLGAAVFLGVSIVLYRVANRSFDGAASESGEDKGGDGEQPLSKKGGFRLLFSSKYLLLIAALILLTNVVNTNGEFIVSNAARTEAEARYPDEMFTEKWAASARKDASALPEGVSKQDIRVIEDDGERKTAIKKARKAYTNSFYGGFYFWVNLAGFIIQAFLVSRLFGLIGVRGALFVLPIISLGGALLIGFWGTLMAIRIAKTAENATDYSLQNTVKQALFLPTSREEKYKAKAAIDTFVVRIGDTLSALLVFVGTTMLAFGRTEFAFLNAGLAVTWLGIALALYRLHKKLAPDAEAPKA